LRGIVFSTFARKLVTLAPTRARFARPSVMSRTARSAEAAGSASSRRRMASAASQSVFSITTARFASISRVW
jgi:hypothetical protein